MARASSSETGFTLVEVLMVVFIIGLAASFVVMSLPERGSTLQEDAALMQRDVNALLDRAVLTGTPHAIEFTASDYKGIVWQAGDWSDLRTLNRELSAGVSLVVSEQGNEDEISRVVFDPTGVPTEGVIEISARGERIEISVNRAAASERSK